MRPDLTRSIIVIHVAAVQLLTGDFAAPFVKVARVILMHIEMPFMNGNIRRRWIVGNVLMTVVIPVRPRMIASVLIPVFRIVIITRFDNHRARGWRPFVVAMTADKTGRCQTRCCNPFSIHEKPFKMLQ